MQTKFTAQKFAFFSVKTRICNLFHSFASSFMSIFETKPSHFDAFLFQEDFLFWGLPKPCSWAGSACPPYSARLSALSALDGPIEFWRHSAESGLLTPSAWLCGATRAERESRKTYGWWAFIWTLPTPWGRGD